MGALHYAIVEHDGGWAYRVGETYSETFPKREAASKAAHLAAGEQRIGGPDAGISYEDRRGVWREELADGSDRPQTEVED